MLNKLPYLARYAPILDFDDPEDLLIRWRGWKRQEIEALCGNPVSFEHTSFYRTYRQFSRTDHFSRYSSLLAGMQDDRVHQTAELAGLKLRFPFRDHRVERVVQGLPISYRFTETEHKRLLRSLLARYVPRAIWDLPKHGLDFPFIALMQANDHELVRTYLDPSLLARHPLLDPAVVQRYAQDFVAGNTGLAFRVWALIVLFGWLEYHGIRH